MLLGVGLRNKLVPCEKKFFGMCKPTVTHPNAKQDLTIKRLLASL